jgi:hypothetical protein
MYIDLLRRSIAGQILEDPPKVSFGHWSDWLKPKRFNKEIRESGKDWPTLAHTMIGGKRLRNLQYCIESVLNDDVQGDMIETGVWRGGASIFMRGILKAYGVTDRSIWVADSFAGLPPPNVDKHPGDRGSLLHHFRYLAVSETEVRANFAKYELLDQQVHFLKGWFRDSLPSAPIEKLAILRMDGDLYESTMDSLTSLYPKLSQGGYVIVDDYFLKPCAKAVADYRQAHGIDDAVIDIDGVGAYWRRTHA